MNAPQSTLSLLCSRALAYLSAMPSININETMAAATSSLEITTNEIDEQEEDEEQEESLVTRALRAYYIETGRPFPAWLPLAEPLNEQYASLRAAHVLRNRRSVLSDLWDGDAEHGMPARERWSAVLKGRHSFAAIRESGGRGGEKKVVARTVHVVRSERGRIEDVAFEPFKVASGGKEVGREGTHLSLGSLRKSRRIV